MRDIYLFRVDQPETLTIVDAQYPYTKAVQAVQVPAAAVPSARFDKDWTVYRVQVR
jgi:hypothetical protein